MPIITNPSLASTMADTTSLQDIFDTCAHHLLTQGARAMAGMSCAYRGRNGTKCAVGCLIADNEYEPAMENKTAVNLMAYAGYSEPTSNKLHLLAKLQYVHDSTAPDTWGRELGAVAEEMGLQFAQPADAGAA